MSSMRLDQPYEGIIWVVIAAVALLPHVYILFLRSSKWAPTRLKDGVAWVGYIGLGFATLAFTFFLLRDMALVAWSAGRKLTSVAFADSSTGILDRTENQFELLHSLNFGILALAFTATCLGLIAARRCPAVTGVKVPIRGLPDSLNGFRIVQISDLHVGPTIKRPFVQAVVDSVNELEADLIAFTGDLVDGPVDSLAHHVEPVAKLKARHGCFFVTGNHEYYSGVDEWLSEVGKLGLQVLLNSHCVVTHDCRRIIVAGVTDWSADSKTKAAEHISDPAAAFQNAPESDVRILLAHQPRTATQAADVDFDLQLSGHTHGGQCFPWKYIISLQQPFVAGLHRLRESSWIYVSRGTGYWGPPIRLGAPSEISCITLIPAYDDGGE